METNTFSTIKNIVEDYFKISPLDINKRTKKQHIADARAIYVSVIKLNTPSITNQALGIMIERHRTSITFNLKKVQNLNRWDKKFSEDYNAIQMRINTALKKEVPEI